MQGKQRIGGVCALAAGAAIVVGLGMYATLLSDYATGDPEPAESVEFIADHYATMYIWNLIVMVAFGVLLVPLALALYERLQDGAEALAQAATAFALIWAALLIGAGMITLIDLGTIADLSHTDPGRAESVWLALDSVERGMGGTIEIVGGLWIFLTSWSALQAHRLPRALNYLGIVISVSAFATIVPALELVGVVFGLGLIVWLGWLGVVMYHTSPSARADSMGPQATTPPVEQLAEG
ncbi:MAG: DUF4386 family protein [Acidimicrobiia bacterium]|nr:DUF4386 family protein [Acidimicrobiia bacterium]